MKNKSLFPFSTPYQSVPFSQIKTEDFLPIIQEEIDKSLKGIERIVTQEESSTFSNTIEKLENNGEYLEVITGILFNLNSAETSDELQKVTQEVAPILSNYRNDILLNQELFLRVKSVFETVDKTQLSVEQQTLLEKQYKSFTRNGALFSEEEKEKLRLIDNELATVGLHFGERVLADTNAFELHVDNLDELKGLPESSLKMAEELATQRDKKGWVFTLDYPSYIPFLTYVEDRELRKKMSIAFGSKGFQNNENNTTELILKSIKLRQERAELLGYESHAAFVLEERMAQSEDDVFTFLNDLLEKTKPFAEKEWEEIVQFGKEELGYDEIQKWDVSFISEKIKQQRFNLDDQKLKPYFSVPSVLKGLFEITNKLFEIELKPIESIDTYHPDVQCFKVINKKRELQAILYIDLYPRNGKRNGAWMTSYRSQKEEQRPHVSIVCNFSPPIGDEPALLTFQEVITLFHEFGHALHGMLADTKYSGLSGTSVYWDFVELPSQLMENWCYQPEALNLFAKHYQTGEVIPFEYVQRIKASSQFQQGMQTLRQLGFGYLDLSYHGKEAKEISNIKKHEKSILGSIQFTFDIEENCMSTSFSHIFQGGYSAGYYSYKWAEVLEADAFELFLEKGIFDKQTAEKMKEEILSKGGTEHPMTLYLRFRGKKPTPEAYLKRSGFYEN